MAYKNSTPTVDDVVVSGVLEVLRKNNNEWRGTMTDLRSYLSKIVKYEYLDILPRSPSALRVVINRVINRLRSRAITLRFGRTHEDRYVKMTAR